MATERNEAKPFVRHISFNCKYGVDFRKCNCN